MNFPVYYLETTAVITKGKNIFKEKNNKITSINWCSFCFFGLLLIFIYGYEKEQVSEINSGTMGDFTEAK